jgi:SAM-dependent methyltransferase
MAHTEFDRDQFAEAYPPGIERSWWHIARNRVIADAFGRHVPQDRRIIEVGCGTGIVTSHLIATGWNVTGVDLGAPKAGLRAEAHLRLGIDAADLPEDERMRFDVLCMFDVIEHVADAPGFLRSLLTAFPNALQVVVTVPARQELWTSFDDHYGHFRRYDRAMLRDEFSQAGLVADEVGYFFHGVHPAITLNNMIRGRKRNIRFTAPAIGIASTMNAAIAAAFVAEAHILPASWPGSSIIGVAHRA